MALTDFDQSFERLVADPSLVELCELQRTGDEVLDVINLSENQHSDILAWMFDAKEGHGQGDEILRDLLVAASSRASADGSGLDGRMATSKFFAAWPPSRIRTTSFGSAFTARELGLKASDRVDLFVIDAQNKFVLLIENKAGAAHTDEQLDRYRNSVLEISGNSRLAGFDIAYIAIDRDFDGDETAERPASQSWLHLGYDWLKTSATRALMHIERGNAAARLVVSYCNRQTDWTNPNDSRCLKLAANLHQSYPDAVNQLISLTQGRAEKEWLTTKSQSEAQFLFRLQNRGAVALLRETRGMASLMTEIRELLPSLPKECIEYSKVLLNICPVEVQRFGNGKWPVFLQATYSDKGKTSYSLALCWYAPSARTNEEAEELRQHLTKIDQRFSKHGQSQWRRVVLGQSMTLPELRRLIKNTDTQLTEAFRNQM